jgi:hypothetical protein
MTSSFTRRSLLSLVGVAGVGFVAAACSSDAPKGSGASTAAAGGSRAAGQASGAASAPAAGSGRATAKALAPAQVPLTGGVTVTVTGAGLAAVRGVTVGGVPARDVKATATKV